MAINTLQNYAAALKQRQAHIKAQINATGNRWWSMSKLTGGYPVAFSTVADSAAGVVPVGGDTGFGLLQPFSGSGKLTAAEAYCTRGVRILFYDRLFHCGPYNTNNTSVTLASQPSYSSRVPGGTDYKGLQLWLESNNSNTGSTLTVTYTDQDGNAGASTSMTIPSLGGANAACLQVPLAAGDSGLSKIESVTTTATGSGTFNLFVARPLFIASLGANDQLYIPMEELGAPEVFSDSAFAILAVQESTTVGDMTVDVEVASG